MGPCGPVDGLDPVSGDPVARAAALHADAKAVHAAWVGVLAERDEAIREALAAGVSAYRVAQRLGVDQALIYRIRHR